MDAGGLAACLSVVGVPHALGGCGHPHMLWISVGRVTVFK